MMMFLLCMSFLFRLSRSRFRAATARRCRSRHLATSPPFTSARAWAHDGCSFLPVPALRQRRSATRPRHCIGRSRVWWVLGGERAMLWGKGEGRGRVEREAEGNSWLGAIFESGTHGPPKEITRGHTNVARARTRPLSESLCESEKDPHHRFRQETRRREHKIARKRDSPDNNRALPLPVRPRPRGCIDPGRRKPFPRGLRSTLPLDAHTLAQRMAGGSRSGGGRQQAGGAWGAAAATTAAAAGGGGGRKGSSRPLLALLLPLLLLFLRAASAQSDDVAPPPPPPTRCIPGAVVWRAIRRERERERGGGGGGGGEREGAPTFHFWSESCCRSRPGLLFLPNRRATRGQQPLRIHIAARATWPWEARHESLPPPPTPPPEKSTNPRRQR
jgi:hypothetical protein